MKYWRTPLDLDRIQMVKGKVMVIPERCKGCEFCIIYCPRGVIQMSKSFNTKGYHYPEVIAESKCANCHFCEVLCPEFAIYSLSIGTGETAAAGEAESPLE